MWKNKSKKSKIFQVVLFLLTLGMLAYFCISGNNLAILLHSLPGLNLFWLLCACACVVLNWILDSMVIHTLVAQAYSQYGFSSSFKVTMVGQYFNSVTPYALAGQPMQLLAMVRQGVSSGIAISTLVNKFLVYQEAISLFSLAVIVVKYHFFEEKIQGFMALAFVGFVYQAAIVVVLLLFSYCPNVTEKLIHGIIWVLAKLHIVKKQEETSEKVKSQLSFYMENNRAMRGNRMLLLRVYGFTLLQLTALFSVPFFIYKAFHCPGAPITDMIAAQSFVTMISSYTPLPGAAGAAEGSFLVLFQMFFPQNILKQAMLLWRLIAYYSCIVAGAFFAGFDSGREKLKSARHSGEPEVAGPQNSP